MPDGQDGDQNNDDQEMQQLDLTLRGTPVSQATLCTIKLSSGLALLVMTAPIVNQAEELGAALEFVLTTAPFITASALQPFVGRAIQRNGGIPFINGLCLISTLSTASIWIMSLTTDLTTLNAFDIRYASLFALTLLSGLSVSVFPLISSITQWSHSPQQATLLRTIFIGAGGVAPAIFLILSAYAIDSLTLPGILGVFAATTLASTIAGYVGLQPPPYFQLQKQYPQASHTLLTANARRLGQQFLHTVTTESYGKQIRRVINSRFWLMTLNICSSAGLGISLNSILFLIFINAADMSVKPAILITAVSSLVNTFTRMASGPIINHLDRQSKGINTFLLGLFAAMVSTITFATWRPFPKELSSIIPLQTLMSIGLGLSGGAVVNLPGHWSEPKNTRVKPYDPHAMFSVIGAAGALSSVIFSLVIALFVTVHDEEGYSDGFAFASFLMFLSMTFTWLMDKHIQTDHSSFWCAPCIRDELEAGEEDDDEESENAHTAPTA